MAKDPDKHFKEAWERVLSQAIVAVQEDALDISKVLRLRLQIVQSQFFKRFSENVIGAERPPDLGEDTPAWASLTLKWIKYKGRLDFYKGLRGDKRAKAGLGPSLEDYFRVARPSQILGLPSVQPVFRNGGTIIRGESFGRGLTRFRGAGGRFVSRDQVKKAVSVGIDVDIYPRVTAANRGFSLEHNLFPTEIAYRLTNPDGTQKRPIFANFMRWWARSQVRSAISKTVPGARLRDIDVY